MPALSARKRDMRAYNEQAAQKRAALMHKPWCGICGGYKDHVTLDHCTCEVGRGRRATTTVEACVFHVGQS